MAYRILLVEDDPDIVRVVQSYLERDGFMVEVVGDGASGLQRARGTPPDLILLDWMLPGLDGLEFLKILRGEQRTPVIMLTARTEEADRILGLEFGADDYVGKPFSPRELVSRVKAVLRRSLPDEDPAGTTIVLGPLTVDPVKREVTVHGERLELTTREFDLLQTLVARPGRVFTRDELLDRVWGRDFAGVDRVVDVQISHLRQKLEPEPERPRWLLTIRGIGYKIAEDPR